MSAQAALAYNLQRTVVYELPKGGPVIYVVLVVIAVALLVGLMMYRRRSAS